MDNANAHWYHEPGRPRRGGVVPRSEPAPWYHEGLTGVVPRGIRKFSAGRRSVVPKS